MCSPLYQTSPQSFSAEETAIAPVVCNPFGAITDRLGCMRTRMSPMALLARYFVPVRKVWREIWPMIR